mgnify:CR=1 FL=1
MAGVKFAKASRLYPGTAKPAVDQIDLDIKDGDAYRFHTGRTFGVEEFRQVLGSRMYKLDPFRYELVDIPFKFHHPMWRENCPVDLDYHVRRVAVPAPGGPREFGELISDIASHQLDRRRPLWELWVVEGLEQGHIGVVAKIHHAAADGVAALATYLAENPNTGYTPGAALTKLFQNAVTKFEPIWIKSGTEGGGGCEQLAYFVEHAQDDGYTDDDLHWFQTLRNE